MDFHGALTEALLANQLVLARKYLAHLWQKKSVNDRGSDSLPAA